ncbi:hypothetical protein A3J41_01035 [candidate division TM6 bacterium RIFCSPHIGHO2_12_FULL_38_8]|nr:MAG: hypothetical protein A3J41_01035 [candidate division TM6 bacterium RIFCSPHIGHO2_12_FULL_38_8]
MIKTEIPYRCTVILLHQKYGKIVCIFGKTDQAAVLTAGSFIWCSVVKTTTFYSLDTLEIQSQLAIKDLRFMHEIMRLCLYNLPKNIAVPELFDFLRYVQGHIDQFDDKSKHVALLRIFLMLDLVPDQPYIYQAAGLNPTGLIDIDLAVLQQYAQQCWSNFHRSKKQLIEP